MPQFILIGKQSVGKSRLIEALAGEMFNFVSGTLGSRRPTVLEFRNANHLASSNWSVLDQKSKQWQPMSTPQVMQVIGAAHEELGATVSAEPVFVRIESPHCVDMQIVDLPGFREFALDSQRQALADQISTLVQTFMEDPRNVMICVEEAGDAANLSTLTRCKRLDPDFKRTILVRNKLDKYYRDLTNANVNDWLNGFGDLPDHLLKFTLTTKFIGKSKT
jgi:GTP-binding protein EngB required for normal cell division